MCCWSELNLLPVCIVRPTPMLPSTRKGCEGPARLVVDRKSRSVVRTRQGFHCVPTSHVTLLVAVVDLCNSADLP